MALRRRSSSSGCAKCTAAAALALSAGLLLASAPSPAAAIGVSPGGLSSFRIVGGQELSEAFGVGSAQSCLDSCFSNANGCNAASFCQSSGGCDGKSANTCVLYKVDDIYNPPGDASSSWMSGTIQQQQQQQQQQQYQQQQPQQVVYQNNNVAGPVVAAAATAALTTAVIAEAGQHRGPVIKPIVPIIVPIGVHHSPVGRKMLNANVAVSAAA